MNTPHYLIVGERSEIRHLLDTAGDTNEPAKLIIVAPDGEEETIQVRPTIWHYSDTAKTNTLLAVEESFGYPVHIRFTPNEITFVRIDR